MQNQRKIFVRILLAIFLLGATLLVFRNARDYLKDGSELVHQSTEKKLKRLHRWIPDHTALVTVLDLNLIRADTFLSALLSDVMRRDSFANGVVQPFLESTDIGMLAVIAHYDEADKPQAAVVMQGAFDPDQLKKMIEEAATAEGITLEKHDVGKAEIYFEKESEAPLAFAFLDRAHWAIGSHDVILKLFSDIPKKSLFQQKGNAFLFGRILFVPRLQKILPHQFASLHEARFFSNDGKQLQAEVPCSSFEEVEALKLFLSGFKSLLLLQHQDNPSITSVLNSTVLFSEGTTFQMTADLSPLIALWGHGLPK
ncbi:MAG: hypothetical protein A3I05_02750 [Deltaproteobacteria bacterium RIFCSPLOWO2_02_FULL_44_10]|nr:MAG: hypothetical protein A3C46_03415 [Deltaproteobacteria bacterium RIFCSPHIGHO2_02_FULL_44_16]OGQ46536.1 MAG: hypothetical protein A3I05_02750 [Deltaproteobacteria bacterium RIFCSPLOWO2_02_FULL_44_10]